MVLRSEPVTIHAVIRHWAERSPDAPAAAAPGRVPLTYGALWRQAGLGIAYNAHNKLDEIANGSLKKSQLMNILHFLGIMEEGIREALKGEH